MRIPISIKMTLITLLLLLAVAIPITMKSTERFTEDSVRRESVINLNFADLKSKEVDYIFKNLIDKLKLTSLLIYKKSVESSNKIQSEEIDLSFEKDNNIVSLDIYNVVDGKMELIHRKSKINFLDKQKLPANFFEVARRKQNFPIREVSSGDKGKIQIKLNSSNSSTPLLSIGIPIVTSNGQITHIAIGDFDLSALQQIFSENSERIFFLVDNAGNLMTHPDEDLLNSNANFLEHPVVKKALTEILDKQQISFVAARNEQFIGAYSKTSYGPIVVSQIAQSVIEEPAYEVRRESLFITGLVLSAAIFFIFLFSSSLTQPIATLASLSHLISKGQFNVQAQEKVTSKDEVGDLAQAFDFMTLGLKERDKMKTLFNKFHGSKITEDLLKKELRLGGSAKEVTVFFSDLRGFTELSEKNTPEEVVKMLNEYFTEMVAIISRNHGVVDKFIGDAIMAVWGAPQATPQDPIHAVKAALEMRLAIAEFNEKRMLRQQPPLYIGIGLHTGKVISGTIGSLDRMEYTIIGDTVNTASRIEGSTKVFGSDLLISESMAEKVKEHFWLEHIGNADLKGKSAPMKLFKVKGYRDDKGQFVEIKTSYSDYKPEKADKAIILSAA